jgi:L-asparaginase
MQKVILFFSLSLKEIFYMSYPKIAVLSLGGTISMTKQTNDLGVTSTLSGQDLILGIPQISQIADVKVISLKQIASGDLTFNDVVSLSKEILNQIDQGINGIVVTQGTSTMEETAFLLDLLINSEEPIVVTGAMRNPSTLSNDGPANLLSAIQVASSRISRGLGTLVVLNDEIHSAKYVRKVHTQGLSAFQSFTGPIGWVVEGRVRISGRPPKFKRHFSIFEENKHSPVALLTLGIGDDGRLIPLLENVGYKGLVIESLGPGHVPSGMVKELERLAKKVPVILASRTGNGEVFRETYAFQGSEIDLLRKGLINAGWLDGLKARVFLELLLYSNVDMGEIPSIFNSYINNLSSPQN